MRAVADFAAYFCLGWCMTSIVIWTIKRIAARP